MHTLQRAVQCRAFRLSYKQPQRTDILSSITICMLNTARLTREFLTTALTYLLTATACFRSVGRRHQVNRYSFSLRFVANVALQLVERPTVVQTALSFTKLFVSRITNPFQVFYHNGFLFCFRFGNNLFGNGVILNLYRGSFSPTKPFKNLFGSFCAFGLQRATYFLSMPTKLIQFFTGKCFSIIGSSNIGDAKINAYYIVKRLFGFVRDVAGLKQVEFSLHIRQICFPLRVFKQTGVMFTRLVGNLLSTFHCPDRSDAFVKFIGKNPAVVSDSSQRPELPLASPGDPVSIQFAVRRAVSIGHFANTSYHYLRRKAGRRFDVVVGTVMDFILTKCLIFPSPSRNTITGSIGLLHGLQQQFGLFGARLKMDFGSQFHIPNIVNFFHILKHLFTLEYLPARVHGGQSAYVFLPRLNRGAGRRGDILRISS